MIKLSKITIDNKKKIHYLENYYSFLNLHKLFLHN